MYIKRRVVSLVSIALFWAFSSHIAAAGTIISPVAVILNTMGTAGGSVARMIDQSGLAPGFSGGVTDFNSYIASNPVHAAQNGGNAWGSAAGNVSGVLDFDLGSSQTIQQMALWTAGSTATVDGFTVFVSNDSGFGTALTVGSFNAPISSNVQTFSIGAVGQYVRLQIDSFHGAGNNINIGEVAFDVGESVSEVSEPAMSLVFAAGVIGFMRLRQKRSS